MKLKTKKVNKKTLVILAVAAFLIVSGGGYLAYSQHFKPSNPNVANPESSTADDPLQPVINYDTPTDQEAVEGQEAKKKLSDTPTDTPTSSSVEVGIANYYLDTESIEVRAFTPSVVEGNGNCTAIFTQNDQRITGKSEAFVDASTSQCRPIVISLTDFPNKGTWKLQVSYKSEKYAGTSPVMEINL